MSAIRPFFFLVKDILASRLIIRSLTPHRLGIFGLWPWFLKIIHLVFKIFFAFRAHYPFINDLLAKLTGMSHFSQANPLKPSGIYEGLHLLFAASGMLGDLNDRRTRVGSEKALDLLEQFLFFTKTLRADISRELNHDNAADTARNQFIINILIHFP